MEKFILKRLYANKDSFHAIEFKRGLNFIVAKHFNEESASQKNTYNGTGKTLIAKLIHYCLGADKSKYCDFIEALPDWRFTLVIEIGNEQIAISRSNEDPKKIYIDEDEPITIASFNEMMQEKIFNLKKAAFKSLTFRNLIPFFIRRDDKKCYQSFDKPTEFFSEYQKLVNNAYLLGINPYFIEKKYKIKTKLKETHDLHKKLNSDSDIRQIFKSSEKDIGLTLKDIEEMINKLEDDLKNFKIAEDYEEIEHEANKLANLIKKTHNKKFLINAKLEKIKKSLDTIHSPDLPKEKLVKVYEEMRIYFSEHVKKRLDDLEIFYAQMIKNREKMLTEQRKKLESELNVTEQRLQDLQQEYDEKMQYLGEHRALDIVLSVKDELEQLKRKKDKLVEYDALLNKYEKEEIGLKRELVEIIQEALEYIEAFKKEFSETSDYFRAIAKRLYPESASGLTIKINDGENQIAYDIEAKIDADSSNGINKAKIFCYDHTLLNKGKNHKAGFIFHDSILFDGIDEVQVAEMFQFLYDTYANNGQYIATLNQNQIDMINKNLDQEMFDRIFSKENVVLTLTDKTSEDKLLGVHKEFRID